MKLNVVRGFSLILLQLRFFFLIIHICVEPRAFFFVLKFDENGWSLLPFSIANRSTRPDYLRFLGKLCDSDAAGVALPLLTKAWAMNSRLYPVLAGAISKALQGTKDCVRAAFASLVSGWWLLGSEKRFHNGIYQGFIDS